MDAGEKDCLCLDFWPEAKTAKKGRLTHKKLQLLFFNLAYVDLETLLPEKPALM